MILGHLPQRAYLRSVVHNASLHHAYLFTGSEMIGMKMVAQDWYRSINTVSVEQVIDTGMMVIGFLFASRAPHRPPDASK